jgi:hypothetical protein
VSLVALDDETKIQIDLLKSIYEVRVSSIRSMMNYLLMWIVAIAAVLLTYAISTNDVNWAFDLVFLAILVVLVVYYSLQMELESKLSRRLGEHLVNVVKHGEIIGSFEDAADELFNRKPRWVRWG